MKKKKFIKQDKTTADNLEQRFDEGKSVMDYFDAENKIKRINLDIPDWAIKALDKEASRQGVTRQALIKNWLIDHLDQSIKKAS